MPKREFKSYEELLEWAWKSNFEDAYIQYINWCKYEWKEAVRRVREKRHL